MTNIRFSIGGDKYFEVKDILFEETASDDDNNILVTATLLRKTGNQTYKESQVMTQISDPLKFGAFEKIFNTLVWAEGGGN